MEKDERDPNFKVLFIEQSEHIDFIQFINTLNLCNFAMMI